LTDIYKVINRLSREVQKPNILPWHVEDSVKHAGRELRSIVQKLQAENPEDHVDFVTANETDNEYQEYLRIIQIFDSGQNRDFSKCLETFKNCKAEFLETSTFKNKKLSFGLESTRLRSQSSATKEIFTKNSVILAAVKFCCKF
jgi:hypothetical protein